MNPVRSFSTLRIALHSTAQNNIGAQPAPEAILQSDAGLVTACLHGDESAWNKLVEKYGRLIYFIACRWTRTPDEADDVFQSVFLIVLQSLSQLQHQQALAGWLATITRHEAQRLGKQSKRWVTLDELQIDDAEHPVEQLHRQLLGDQVRYALTQLDPFTREFLVACMADPAPPYEELRCPV